MIPNLKIASLNVRGIRNNPRKRVILNELLSIHSLDVVFLQETHIQNFSQASNIFKNFNYESFHSFGEFHSKGVSILISSSLDVKVMNHHHDNLGRLFCIDILLNNFPIRLINVYCPNNPLERRLFIKRLDTVLSTSKDIVMGGDFNCVENTQVDKNIYNESLGTAGRNEIFDLKRDFDIHDPFRVNFPNKVLYTWSGRGIYCRLDRFYISKKLIPYFSNMSTVSYPLSDHSMVCMVLRDFSGAPCVGSSYWKANTIIFEDENFVNDLDTLWGDFTNFNFKESEWWLAFKENVRDLVVFHSKRRSERYACVLREKEKELKNLLYRNSINPGTLDEKIKSIETHINDLLLEKAEGAKIRSNSDILNNEEKPSRYFFCREQSRQKQKLIHKIIDQDTNTVYNKQTDITNFCKEFYSNLYTEQPVDSSLINYFTDDLNMLDPLDADSCEGAITFDECFTAIKEMHNGKTPGPDGLPREFYFKYFHVFGRFFVDMINNCFNNNFLPESFLSGYITLLCKDKNNPENIKNWRPISLLNFDYKIISKVLTNRLKKVMSSIINIDQTCAIPGRSIFDNCHLLRNIIDYAGQKKIETLIVSLDLEKAFDKVSHQYLFTVLEKFGFGPDFSKWIRLLYTDAYTSLIINGHISDSFSYERGVRQGCCLSPLLYVLTIEPLAERIRRDNDIKGITLPVTGEVAKISQYADDLTAILTSRSSVNKLLVLLDIFHYASGSHINKNKSKALSLGFWRNRPPDDIGGIPIVDHLKVIGVYIYNSGCVSYDWLKLTNSIQKLVTFWKSRKLSFFEKSLLINSVALAKIWYIASSILIPCHVIEKINKMLFSFLWGKRHECISRKSMMQSKQCGGVGILDIDNKITSIRLSHIKKLLVSAHSKWKTLAVYWFGFHLRLQEPVFGSNLIPHSDVKPPFYTDLFSSFKLVNSIIHDLEWEKTDTKSLYNILSSRERVSHKVESKFPDVNFTETWRSFNSGLLAPYNHDLSFLIAHHVLPTCDLLYRFNISRRLSCFFCKEKESIKHLFFECLEVKELLVLVSELLSTSANTFIISLYNILFHVDLPHWFSKGLHKLFIILSSEIKNTIWILRNEAKFNHRDVKSGLIRAAFIKSIHRRIIIDYNRLSLNHFLEIWGVSTICEVSEDEIKVILH